MTDDEVIDLIRKWPKDSAAHRAEVYRQARIAMFTGTTLGQFDPSLPVDFKLLKHAIFQAAEFVVQQAMDLPGSEGILLPGFAESVALFSALAEEAPVEVWVPVADRLATVVLNDAEKKGLHRG